MPVLDWNKPKKLRPQAEHNRTYVADGAPDGAYVPNMSDEDKLKWKAIYHGGSDPRVEIRKSFYHHNDKPYPNHIGYSAQALIVVRVNANSDEPTVLISANGKMGMTLTEAMDLPKAIREAMDKIYVEAAK